MIEDKIPTDPKDAIKSALIWNFMTGSNMKRLFCSEFYRLTHSLWLAAIMLLLIAAISWTSSSKTASFSDALEERRYVILFGVVLSAYYFSVDFKDRGFNNAIYIGFNRGQIIITKHICYCITCCVIIILSLLITICLADIEFAGLGALYIARCLGIRLIIDLSYLSIFTLIAYTFRNVLYMLCIGSAYAFVLIIFNPSHWDLWQEGSRIITGSMNKPLLLLFASPLLAWLIFRKAELK